MEMGGRVERGGVSTIDTARLLGRILVCRGNFERRGPEGLGGRGHGGPIFIRVDLQWENGPAPPGVTGHRGFFYHFLDMETGRRFERVELSTIDTALLLSGILVCREYFDGSGAEELEIRALADSIYFRVD